MLEAQNQQHLKSLRKAINKALGALRDGERVIFHTGWGHGVGFRHPFLDSFEDTSNWPEAGVQLILPSPSSDFELVNLEKLLPSGLKGAMDRFWPGPLDFQVRIPGGMRLLVSCPWHPLAQELLERSGPLFWAPLSAENEAAIASEQDPVGGSVQGARVIRWPQPTVPLKSTLLDISTRPWRYLKDGFVGAEELEELLREPFVLSEERAFPLRGIPTYKPEGKTLVVEVAQVEDIPATVKVLREQVPPDAFLRLYLDEETAHQHFPDDREVRVYGDFKDLERVRRRLEAMLGRQKRRLGKRVLLIVVGTIEPEQESFRQDLAKLSDSWLEVSSPEKAVLEA